MKKKITGEPFAFPTPIFIVATYNEDGSPNAMNAAWAGVSVSKPPCLTVSLQGQRKTYENIKRTGEFTVNIPNKKTMKEADYFGMISGHKTNKFADTGLTATKAEFVDAPFIEEFPVCFECKVREITEIGTHCIIIGEILNSMADESLFNENGKASLENADGFIFDPVTLTYLNVGEVVGKAFSIGREFKK